MSVCHRHQLRDQNALQPACSPAIPPRARAETRDGARALGRLEEPPPASLAGDPQARHAPHPRRPSNAPHCTLHLPPVPRGHLHDLLPLDRQQPGRRPRLGGLPAEKPAAVRALRASSLSHRKPDLMSRHPRPVSPLFAPFLIIIITNKKVESTPREKREQKTEQNVPHSKFLDLISVSICMTFLDVATSSREGAKKSISYLSMGCGIFGRLNLLDNEVPLADVLELTRTAQQIRGK